ncbi:hypothetical protein ABZY09_49535 [Streptomyces sp. NPDC002928]|uniref:hypothetical protein n=1 Tax=Streptomyces sp. NPDC002928 TaxID=3154440 RepID=UPI0033A8C1E5
MARVERAIGMAVQLASQLPLMSLRPSRSSSGAADDVSRVGLDAADVRKVADLAAEHHNVLDEITQPRLLTGDLWTVH